MPYLNMFPDYINAPQAETVTTFAFVPRQKIKKVQISISVPERDIHVISGFLSQLAYVVSMSDTGSALYISNEGYKANDDDSLLLAG